MHFFDNVETFSFYVAPSRSGHSVLAHLLSAHPEVLFSDELDALMWIDEGFSAREVYALIKYQNKRYGRAGRRKSGYDYKVPGSWQYVWDKYPKVVGDSKGRQSIQRMSADPSFIDRLRQSVAVPIRAFVQARHPYDVAASEMRNRGWNRATAVDRVIEEIEMIDIASQQLDVSERMIVYHEDVMKDPKTAFEQMFSFLGVEPHPDTVQLCAQKMWSPPSKRSSSVKKKRKDEDTERLDHAILQSGVFARYVTNPELSRSAVARRIEIEIAKVRRRL